MDVNRRFDCITLLKCEMHSLTGAAINANSQLKYRQ